MAQKTIWDTLDNRMHDRDFMVSYYNTRNEEIKKAHPTNEFSLSNVNTNTVSINDLRDDVIIESSELEKEIIIQNFPKEKGGYLVVAKIIED